MLAVTVQRFVVTFGTETDMCGPQPREHFALLFLQAMAALGVSAGLALACPAMVRGDRWYRRGALALVVIAGLIFLAILTKQDLMAYATGC